MHRINLDASTELQQFRPEGFIFWEWIKDWMRILYESGTFFHHVDFDRVRGSDVAAKLYRIMELARPVLCKPPEKRFLRILRPSSRNPYCYLFLNAMRIDHVGRAFVLDAHVMFVHRGSLGLKLDTDPADAETRDIVVAAATIETLGALFPLWAERCRRGWLHRPDCAYRDSEESDDSWSPICFCGNGKDRGNAYIGRDDFWNQNGDRLTRVAIGMPWELRGTTTNNVEKAASDACHRCRRRIQDGFAISCPLCNSEEYCSEECCAEDRTFHASNCKSRT